MSFTIETLASTIEIYVNHIHERARKAFWKIYKTIIVLLMNIWLEIKKILCPVDTGRKLNVHKTFRRRPGHLLNVLCTFNLCPVSAGWIHERDLQNILVIYILVI